MRAVSPCGTYAAFVRHGKRGEAPCDPCRHARAEYLREYRRNKPDKAAVNRARVAARSRAMTRLAAEFPDRFRALYEAEMRTTGGA